MRLLVFLLVIAWAGKVAAHPLHLTVVNVDYAAADTSLLITIKVFYDDFSLALNHNFASKEKLEGDISDAEQQLWSIAYLNKNFRLQVNGKYLGFSSGQLIKQQREGNAQWFHFKTKLSMPPKELAITNTLLNDVYFDQQNLFFYRQGKQSENFIFGYKKHSAQFSAASGG